MEPVDPRDLRISDADRHRVAELLREAAGEGRLDLDELDQRLEQAYAARTYGDLVPLTLDLPTHTDTTPVVRAAGTPVPAPSGRPVPWTPGPPPTWNTSLAIMSESRRSGVWLVGETHVATSVMGSVVIDLREAVFPAGRAEVTIWANAVMGSVQVLVDHTTAVVVEGVGIMGTFAEHRSRFPTRVEASSPVVRVKGVALMGSVEVRRKETDEQKRRRRELGSSG